MSENNSKLFVFDRNEVFLIFLFVVLMALISFVLGLRLGKQLSLKDDGYSKQDTLKIDLKSVEEENIEGALNNADINKPVELDTEARLRKEMEKLAKEKIVIESEPEQVVEEADLGPDEVYTNGSDEEIKEQDDVYLDSANYEGKYTIQLYAHQSKEMAQNFADVFILKGYDVIINEVVIPGKGKWYRVSVGAFDSINSAKEYLVKESDLFQGKKYLIKKL